MEAVTQLLAFLVMWAFTWPVTNVLNVWIIAHSATLLPTAFLVILGFTTTPAFQLINALLAGAFQEDA